MKLCFIHLFYDDADASADTQTKVLVTHQSTPTSINVYSSFNWSDSVALFRFLSLKNYLFSHIKPFFASLSISLLLTITHSLSLGWPVSIQIAIVEFTKNASNGCTRVCLSQQVKVFHFFHSREIWWKRQVDGDCVSVDAKLVIAFTACWGSFGM